MHLSRKIALAVGLSVFALPALAATTGKPALALQEGDIVALCGDSITSNGAYPGFIELYQLLCSPAPKVTLKNFGRWGEVAAQFPPIIEKDVAPAKPTVATICYGMNNCRSAKVMSDGAAEAWAGSIKTVVDKLKQAGVRTVVLASPGCVDTTYFALSQNAAFDPAPVESTNKNLSMLRDAAAKLAAKEGYIYADMHSPMIEVMAKAKEKYGKEYAFAGGKGDGVHPGQAGHLVMAWVYLKALGYDGDIGTITVDLAKQEARGTDGHKVVSFKDGAASLESTRSPFCFPGDAKNPAAGSSALSVVELFPFNQDLNRLTLVVQGAKARRLSVTWGTQSKEFDAAVLEKGINLAAEFLENPFCARFFKCLTALGERNQCRNWLRMENYKNDTSIPKRLDAALKTLEPVAVSHTIKVEEKP